MVIAIVALLIALLLPALQKTRSAGKIVVCKSNLHQLGIAAQAYLGDWNDTFPSAQSAAGWPTLFAYAWARPAGRGPPTTSIRPTIAP